MKRLFSLLAVLMLVFVTTFNSTYANNSSPPEVEDIVIVEDLNIVAAPEIVPEHELFERGVIVLSPGDIKNYSYDAEVKSLSDYALFYKTNIKNEYLVTEPRNNRKYVYRHIDPGRKV